MHLIAQYEKEISENVCCSCRRLLRRKNMTEVKGNHKIRQSGLARTGSISDTVQSIL